MNRKNFILKQQALRLKSMLIRQQKLIIQKQKNMSVNLVKGEKVDLTKNNPTTVEYGIGLGWDPQSNGGEKFDLDVSVFITNSTGKMVDPGKDFVFFNNLINGSKSVTHTGDNLTGDGDGDDEVIHIDFSKCEPTEEAMHFVVNIYDAKARKQNFGQVNNAFIRVFDKNTKAEIMRYDLSEDFSAETSVEFGKLYKKDGEWKFNATGIGSTNGLDHFLNQFS